MDANRSYPLAVVPHRKKPRIHRRINRSPSQQSTTKKHTSLGKVCLICDCSPDDSIEGDFFSYGENGGMMDYCVFLLDLDAEGGDYVPQNPYLNFKKYEGYVPRNPNLCFDSITLCISGFCALGSTLYLFGDETNDVFSYDLLLLPQEGGFVVTLTKDMLTAGPPMNFPKTSAGGCQTPDGKMIVLSTEIGFDKEGSTTFELFDPSTNQWELLPDLLPLLPPRRPYNKGATDVRVHSYSFINNEPDLLVTTSAGNFTLDMRSCSSSNKSWSLRRDFKWHPAMLPRFMLVKDDELCLSDWDAFLLDGSRGVWSYPTLEPRSDPQGDGRLFVMNYSYRGFGKGITWLMPPPSSSDRFCVAHTHVHRKTKQPYLILDVCRLDWDVFQEKKKEIIGWQWDLDLPGLTVIKRFKYAFGPQTRFDDHVYFNPCGLFPI